MVRRQEPLLRQQTILVTQPPLTETAMVIPLEPLPLLQITLVIRPPLIVTDMETPQGQARLAQTTLVILEQITMILMAILQALLIVVLTISEQPELLIRIRGVIPGDRQHHQRINL